MKIVQKAVSIFQMLTFCRNQHIIFTYASLGANIIISISALSDDMNIYFIMIVSIVTGYSENYK